MENIINSLKTHFIAQSNPETASWKKAYLKNQFEFFGISTPLRSKIEKEIKKQYPLSNEIELKKLIVSLWEKPQREYQGTAIYFLRQYHTLWTTDFIYLFEKIIKTKSWWDTVDDIAVHCVGKIIMHYPHLISHMDQWIHDENMWIRRSALLFQITWKRNTDEERLASYCKHTMHEKNFFIRKAIGWSLRKYSKTNALFVQKFVEQHRNDLSGVSLREATKYLKTS